MHKDHHSQLNAKIWNTVVPCYPAHIGAGFYFDEWCR